MSTHLSAFVVLFLFLGCTQPNESQTTSSNSRSVVPGVTCPNTLQLGDETFSVTQCYISGYLRRKDGLWYCCWCFGASGEERTFVDDYDGTPYEYLVKPDLNGNTVPINVSKWRDLDGISFTTGEHEEGDFYRGHSSLYTMFTTSTFETCSNNRVRIDHVESNKFRLQWEVEAYLGVVESDRFALDAIATLGDITLSGEVENESEVDNDAIGRIFKSVFPNDDFQQHPADMRRIDEGSIVTIAFTSRFTPKM